MFQPRVALLIETSGGYGRHALAGIAEYARLNGPWSFFLIPRGHDQSLPDMKSWKGTGIIARVESTAVANAIISTQLPVVGLGVQPQFAEALRRKIPFCEIHTQALATARLAVDHLIDRGFRTFAFVGVKDQFWSQEREAAFVDIVSKEKGFPCTVYSLREITRAKQYGQDQEALGEWLKSLPKPVGLMSCNDDCGREVLDTAMLEGVSVPDDIGVIGVDNDDVLCELCNPPLSSVIPNARRAGFEAAAVLDQLMKQEGPVPKTTLVEPVGVTTRQSSDVVAVNDRQIAAAVRFIREHACTGIAVEDVLKAVPMSRSILERRFKKLLGQTPHDYILRVKLDRARELLALTDLPLARIAERSGFEHVEYFSVAFKRLLGASPSIYRTRQRA